MSAGGGAPLPPDATGVGAMLRRRLGRIAISALVTVAFLGLAWALLDVPAVVAALGAVDTGLLVVALVMGLGLLILRWLRLAVAVRARADVTLLRAAALHGAAVAVLPAKLGELILPLALNRMTGMSLTGAVGLLLVIRLYDLLALVVIGAVALVAAGETVGLTWLRWPAVLAALAAGVAMLLLPVLAKLARTALSPWLGKWRRAHDIFDRLSVGMATLRPGQVAALIGFSAAIWCAVFAMFHVVAVATNGAVDVATTALAGTAGALVFALPVNGVANVGPFEAAWAAVATRAGIDAEIAIAGALAAHAMMIVVNVVAAGVALLFGGRNRLAP